MTQPDIRLLPLSEVFALARDWLERAEFQTTVDVGLRLTDLDDAFLAGIARTLVSEALKGILQPMITEDATVGERVKAPRVGESFEGGIYVGVARGEPGKPDYLLIVANAPDGNNAGVTWGPRDAEQKGALSEFDGLANTQALEREYRRGAHPAAEWAAGLTLSGLSDWYLPARRELALCYANVPEVFEKVWHWSSTQSAGNAGCAWGQGFGNGNQSYGRKSDTYRARAVRRILID
jgi:hypothetical protein